MRMEELNNNNFIKGTDTVERYLLDLIKQYFDNSGIADEDSREYIIQKAVARMREELYIDNAGVVSINGQIGEVDITLASLGGEPQISPKLSAFNVNFGNENGTACEGDDPRLSDKRNPTAHKHSMDEVNGLSGELSSIVNKIGLLSNTTHKHLNKSVIDKLTYSGNKDTIDLTILDTAANLIQEGITETDAAISNVTTKLNNLITQATNELTEYSTGYYGISDYIDTAAENIGTSVKEYTDNKANTSVSDINISLENKMTKTDMNALIELMNQQYTLIYTTTITNFINTEVASSIYELVLPTVIATALAGLTNSEYILRYKFHYTDPTSGKKYSTILPLVYGSDTIMQYSIYGVLENETTLKINATRYIDTWDTFISNASVTFEICTINKIAEV